MSMWLHSFEGWVCAWPRCYALSSSQHRVKGSCIPHIIRFNDEKGVQTWDRPTKWQTSCLSPLPFAISQATNPIESFLQAIWSDLSKPSTYTQRYFTITSSTVTIPFHYTFCHPCCNRLIWPPVHNETGRHDIGKFNCMFHFPPNLRA
jgi:hypothetical protein